MFATGGDYKDNLEMFRKLSSWLMLLVILVLVILVVAGELEVKVKKDSYSVYEDKFYTSGANQRFATMGTQPGNDPTPWERARGDYSGFSIAGNQPPGFFGSEAVALDTTGMAVADVIRDSPIGQ